MEVDGSADDGSRVYVFWLETRMLAMNEERVGGRGDPVGVV